MSRADRTFSTQTLLVILVVGILAPVILFAGLVIAQLAEVERARFQQEALNASRRIAASADRELAGLQSALQVLSTSRNWDLRDFVQLRVQALQVRDLLGADIVFKDVAGQHLVNTRLPEGSPLPLSLQENDRLAMTDRRAVVSDLFVGTTFREAIISLAVPLVRNGSVEGVVSVGVPIGRFVEVLANSGLPEGWVGALVDNSDRIIARSRQHERYAGALATADLRARTTGEEGTWTGRTVDGVDVLSGFARVKISRWRAAVGIPVAAVEIPLQRSLAWLFGLGALGLAAAAIVAAWSGQQIARPLRLLASDAEKLGSETPILRRSSRLREIKVIGDALDAASRNLVARAAARDDAEAALSQGKERLARILDTSPVGIVEIDQLGAIRYANNAAVQILGLQRAEIEGLGYDSPVWQIATVGGDPIPPETLPLARALRGETVTGFEHMLFEPGRVRVISVNATPIRAEGGIIGALAAFTDITVQHAAERELRDFSDRLERLVAERTQELENTNAQLRAEIVYREKVEEQLRQAQKMESIGHLTGGIAHDFNNLLAAIGGSLEILQRRLDRGEIGTLQRFIDNAQEATRRAAVLTHRLLAFSRRQPLAPELVDANRLVGGMTDLIRRTIGEHIAIETAYAEGLWTTEVDPHQLEQAILNLAVNARDAMRDGGRITITTQNVVVGDDVSAEGPAIPAGSYVMIALADSGVGIPVEIRDRVFDPFFTTKPAGKGTGLGLSQVYGFVRQSGGQVLLCSEAGQGTTVQIFLPRCEGVAAPAAPPSARRDVSVSDRRETVLVVEDEAGVRRMSVDAFQELGYRVLHADGAAAAMAILGTEPDIALLFTDVVMPEVNGARLAEEARRLRPELKVLFTTGYTRDAVVHDGVLDPDVHVLLKPFTLDQLAERLREVLPD